MGGERTSVPVVLFVDDDEHIRHFLARALAHCDRTFTVLTAADGAEALAILEHTPVAVVVTDLQMPVMDGYALLKAIQQRWPQLPRIVLSGEVAVACQAQVKALGALDFWAKPVLPSELIRRLTHIVATWRPPGFLLGLPFDTLSKLYGLDQKSCQITVRNADDGRIGQLIFRNGCLADARVEPATLRDAACEILSWPRVEVPG